MSELQPIGWQMADKNQGHGVPMWIYDSVYKNKPYKIYSMVQISVMYVYTYTYMVYFMIQKNNSVKVNFNWIPKVNYNFIVSLTKSFKVILSSDGMQREAGVTLERSKAELKNCMTVAGGALRKK